MRATNYQQPTISHRWIVPERIRSTLVEQLLQNRGITDPERFFKPDYARDSHDPVRLPGITAAVDRLVRAVERRERVAVYADYDADGIPGGALLVKLLRANGLDPISYIPDRAREGYGLNEPAIAALKQRAVDVIITVDLGVTNDTAVQRAAASGIDVIVTDHHTVDPARIPSEAVAVVHPALPATTYPFDGLAGGGVAWKLAEALSRRTGRPAVAELKWWLELPAISTVCDLVPLRDENRMIVHFGLTVLRKTRSVGLQALCQAGAIDLASINERTIGFQIGPRLNAPGRMNHASPALELLLTDDPARATILASQLEEQNRSRQQLLERVVSEAIAKIRTFGDEMPTVIILSDPEWPIGILGLAASRIVERYHRPVILLNQMPDGRAQGSARSIDGFNVIEALTAQRDLLVSFGGHTGAAGLTLDHAALTKFTDSFSAFAAARLTPTLLERRLSADAQIAPTELTESLMLTIDQFAPFGVTNPVPRFVVGPLIVAEVRRLGADGQHLKLQFRNAPFPALVWRVNERSMAVPANGQTIRVLGRPEWNVWNGQRSIQFILDDWQPVEV